MKIFHTIASDFSDGSKTHTPRTPTTIIIFLAFHHTHTRKMTAGTIETTGAAIPITHSSDCNKDKMNSEIVYCLICAEEIDLKDRLYGK
jgi:hypothetical protein